MIIGSGASINYFPGTAQITEELKKWDVYLEPPLDNPKNWLIAKTLDSKGLPYYKAVFEAVKSYYENPKAYLNFERLIHISLQLDSITKSEKAVDEFRPLLKPFIKFKDEFQKFDQPHINSMIADDASTYILNWLSKKYTPNLFDQLRNSCFNRFLKRLSGLNYGIHLFSLNYDTQPLYSDLAFETGFRSVPGSKFQIFSPLEFLEGNYKHLYCQIHGSTLFGYSLTPLEGAPPGKLVRYNEVGDAIDSRNAIRKSKRSKQDGFPSTSDCMITGLRKADDILSEPYASYLYQLFQELISTNNWVLIGYGGRDPHINECLRRARHVWKQRAKKLKILWIGYASDNAFKYGEIGLRVWLPISEECYENMVATLPEDCIDQIREEAKNIPIKRDEVQLIKTKSCDALISFRGTEETLKSHTNQIIEFLNN